MFVHLRSNHTSPGKIVMPQSPPFPLGIPGENDDVGKKDLYTYTSIVGPWSLTACV